MKNEDFILHLDEALPENEYNRVHAILVTKDGRCLLRYKNGDPRITGGRIEEGDVDLEETLKREVLEEINCKIDRCNYIAYLDVTCDKTSKREKWARMVARVGEIGEARPDPDRENNWIYGRELVPEDVAKERLANSMPIGNTAELVEKAFRIARENNYFTDVINNELEVINLETVDGKVVEKLLQ